MIDYYAHEVVKNFIKEFPTTYQNMQKINHNDISKGIISDWHGEGSIWAHTMMVLGTLRKSLSVSDKRYKELILAALLHDVGKIHTREINQEKQKVTFYGHPGISTILARNMISTLDRFMEEEGKIYILRLINYHQLLFDVTEDMSQKAYQKFFAKIVSPSGYSLLRDIVKLRDADTFGRISRKVAKPDPIMEVLYTDLAKYQHANPITIPPENAPKAVILVGLPGAGKSYHVLRFFKDYALISRDQEIYNLVPETYTYNEAWDFVDQALVDKNFEITFNEAMQRKQNLVIDRTNLTYKGRKKFIDRLKNQGYQVQLHVIFPDSDILYRRNASREGKIIPANVIRQMAKSLELPFESEGEITYFF